MSRARVCLGRRGEQLAAEHLARRGYQVVQRNFRCRAGEIDLVARQAEAWVFVEVRARRGQAYGPPEASLTTRKRRHLIAAARTYLQAHQLQAVAWRIDVVAIDLGPDGTPLRLEVIENAIQE